MEEGLQRKLRTKAEAKEKSRQMEARKTQLESPLETQRLVGAMLNLETDMEDNKAFILPPLDDVTTITTEPYFATKWYAHRLSAGVTGCTIGHVQQQRLRRAPWHVAQARSCQTNTIEWHVQAFFLENSPRIHGLFIHTTRHIMFALVVDDLVQKHTFLIQVIKQFLGRTSVIPTTLLARTSSIPSTATLSLTSCPP
jgi:hypothetical protein